MDHGASARRAIQGARAARRSWPRGSAWRAARYAPGRTSAGRPRPSSRTDRRSRPSLADSSSSIRLASAWRSALVNASQPIRYTCAATSGCEARRLPAHARWRGRPRLARARASGRAAPPPAAVPRAVSAARRGSCPCPRRRTRARPRRGRRSARAARGPGPGASSPADARRVRRCLAESWSSQAIRRRSASIASRSRVARSSAKRRSASAA